ncbi:hypothetical protein [Streptomyces sp. NPDC002520]
MNQVEICEDLASSARRWARTSIEAYLEEPPDQDFAVHHMAVAVEHMAKAYLVSVTPGLLTPKNPKVSDLLVLGGHEDKTAKGRAALRTVGGEDAVDRAGEVLGDKRLPTADLNALRDARNGITHMGWGRPASECRKLLASGVTYIDSLLAALSREQERFWGRLFEPSRHLVTEAMSELKLRYQAKLRQARENFARTTDHLSADEKAAVIASLSAAPVPSRWLLHIPHPCPACESPAFVSGRDRSGDYGEVWFFPRHFGCRVCRLTLIEQELDLAGIEAHTLADEPEVDPDWEPDTSVL